jgi:ABC-type uncharacterized transport system substrate-binding protein
MIHRHWLTPVFLSFGFALLATPPASAHPHVWTEMNTDLVFSQDGLIEGLAIQWTFDDAYAQDALSEFTPNTDGSYSAAELEALTRENVESLSDYEYFTVMRLDEQKLPIGKVNAKLAKNIWQDGKLSLLLFVPLAEPVDPHKGQFTAKVFDPEYYVAIDYRDDAPYHVTGKPPDGCTVSLKPLQTEADLQKTRDYLATKGKDWKPDQNQEFGEIFARPLTVECVKP